MPKFYVESGPIRLIFDAPTAEQAAVMAFQWTCDKQVEIQAKYQGYIDRQLDEVAKSLANEEARLPDNFDYSQVGGLSKEVQQKLALHRPQTIGQASRIQGITPAAVSLLLIHLKRHSLSQAA